jgi:hypothetical protein
MGATVFKQAKAFSFATTSGPIGYAWLEETYDKKDGPQRARWSVTAIGTREDIIDRIFLLSKSIPGASLHVKHSSSSSFITAMKKNLDTPERMVYTTLRLANSADGFYDAITNKNRQAVRELFLAYGKEEQARYIEHPVQSGGQNIVLNLVDDMELVRALQKRDPLTGETLISPWRMLNNHGQKPVSDGSGPSEKDAQPRVTIAPVDIQIMQAGIDNGFQNNATCLCLLDGEPFGMGDLWHIETRLLDRAGKLEHSQPGFYKAALKALQLASEQVKQVPEDVSFKIDGSKAPAWSQEEIKQIALSITGEPVLELDLTLAQIKTAFQGLPDDKRRNMKYHLNSILTNSEMTTVVMPEAETEQAQMFERARG